MMLRELIWPRRVICLVCGGLTHGAHLCADCLRAMDELRLLQNHAVRLSRLTASVWAHEGPARQLVHTLKYHAVEDAVLPLAEGVAGLIRQLPLPGDTVLTWVPMPDARRRERGIDHGQCLADAVSRLTQLPVLPLIGRRDQRCGRPQEGLTRIQRLQNLRHAFISPEPIHRPVLLVDDVLTTGATAAACTKCLLAAGAPRVQVVTATRALLRQPFQPLGFNPRTTPTDMEETT